MIIITIPCNVNQTVYILKKYRREFEELTGIEFDPLSVLKSIHDADSPFWNSVFRNHYLHGLLLGFGEKNAFLFDRIQREKQDFKKASFQRFPEFWPIEEYAKRVMKKKVSIQNLVIPYFVTFDIHDETLDKYNQEKIKIIDFFQEKDFVSVVLDCLDIPVNDSSQPSDG